MFERLEDQTPLEAIARGEIRMPAAARERLDQSQNLVMSQRMRWHER
jgi:hypothetical protein